jgi:hypothetical protein
MGHDKRCLCISSSSSSTSHTVDRMYSSYNMSSSNCSSLLRSHQLKAVILTNSLA